jgi:mRNA-degrading endonuclease RelE of RelBE toxin-antitoxin system
MKLDLTIDLDPTNIAKELRRLSDKERRQFVEEFVSVLDADSYHCASVLISENPDDSVECPRCKRHTYGIARKGLGTKCSYCAMVLP